MPTETDFNTENEVDNFTGFIKIIPIDDFDGLIEKATIISSSFDIVSDSKPTMNLQLLTKDGVLVRSLLCTITDELYSNWGTDHTEVIDFCLAQKGIERFV